MSNGVAVVTVLLGTWHVKIQFGIVE